MHGFERVLGALFAAFDLGDVARDGVDRLTRHGRSRYAVAATDLIDMDQQIGDPADEIDLCDTKFYARALPVLERREADLVIGSKLAEGSKDERPL